MSDDGGSDLDGTPNGHILGIECESFGGVNCTEDVNEPFVGNDGPYSGICISNVPDSE